MECTWRLQPARQIEDLFGWLCPGASYPPELSRLKFAITFRLRYQIVEVPPTMQIGAKTFHAKRLIILPTVCEAKQLEMLIHEVAEIFLRLTCSEEYHYTPEDNGDELHRVSTLVHRRAKRKIVAEKRHTIERQIDSIEQRRQALERQVRILQEQLAAEEELLRETEILLADL